MRGIEGWFCATLLLGVTAGARSSPYAVYSVLHCRFATHRWVQWQVTLLAAEACSVVTLNAPTVQTHMASR